MGILLNKSKNYIINGSVDFWQRNTSFAAIASATYFADRFQYLKSGTMVHTVSRSTDIPTDSSVTYSMLLDVTTAQASIGAAEFNFISHKIEGSFFNNLKGKSQTLKFRVKATKTGIYCVAFRNSAQDRTLVKEYTISASNTWETKTITFTHDTTGVWDYSTGIGLQLCWTIAAGSSLRTTADTWQSGGFIATANQVNGVDNLANDFRISEIQLEEGTSASNFERAGGDYANELPLCQRYFQKSWSIDTAVGTSTASGSVLVTSNTSNNNSFGDGYVFGIIKRVSPSMAYYSSTGTINVITTNGGNSTGGFSSTGESGFVFTCTDAVLVKRSMQFHWTADAEL